ncbi:hypothetical protein [Sporosarcina sp. Te-1]|nr:hypothetical protein [Sporosarcina sp. Te-1]
MSNADQVMLDQHDATRDEQVGTSGAATDTSVEHNVTSGAEQL